MIWRTNLPLFLWVSVFRPLSFSSPSRTSVTQICDLSYNPTGLWSSVILFSAYFLWKIFWFGPFFVVVVAVWYRTFLKSLLNLLQYCFCLIFGVGRFGPEACGLLAPWPGIELTPLALEGEVLTTGPPGKSSAYFLLFLLGLFCFSIFRFTDSFLYCLHFAIEPHSKVFISVLFQC